MEAKGLCQVRHLILVLLFAASLCVSSEGQIRAVRVWLKSWEGSRSLEARADAGLVLLRPEGTQMRRVAPGEPLRLVATSEDIEAGGVQVGREVVLAALFGPIEIKTGQRSGAYRGWLRATNVQGKLRLINEVALESYLMSVVPAEMPSTFPAEALKAQAIAARTFAMKRMTANSANEYDLTDAEGAQTYTGVSSEKPNTTAAIMETAGWVLVHEGNYCDAVYSADCGGHTAASDEMGFGAPAPYLVGTPDESYCVRSPHRDWRVERTAEQWRELARRLGKEVGKVQSVEIVAVGPSGRAQVVRITGERATLDTTGSALRRVLGNDVCKSTLFSVQSRKDGWVLVGNGWGHGVGLCQHGAAGRASAGQGYVEILAAYYPGSELRKVLNDERLAQSERR